MVKLENYPILIVDNFLNLGTQQFYQILEVLRNDYIVPTNTKSNTFLVNNYINGDKSNQLYDPEQ